MMEVDYNDKITINKCASEHGIKLVMNEKFCLPELPESLLFLLISWELWSFYHDAEGDIENSFSLSIFLENHVSLKPVTAYDGTSIDVQSNKVQVWYVLR